MRHTTALLLLALVAGSGSENGQKGMLQMKSHVGISLEICMWASARGRWGEGEIGLCLACMHAQSCMLRRMGGEFFDIVVPFCL